MHRIDRDTSGLLLFAKNQEAHKYFNQLFEQRAVEKKYIGLLIGSLSKDEDILQQPIEQHPSIPGKMRVGRNGKPSVTHYQVVERFRGYSLASFTIETGRTHQIRVHMQDIGYALVCDPLYGSSQPILLSALKKKFKLSKAEEVERPLLNRLALHAYSIELKNLDGKIVKLTAPLSKDFEVTLLQLRKYAKL